MRRTDHRTPRHRRGIASLSVARLAIAGLALASALPAPAGGQTEPGPPPPPPAAVEAAPPSPASEAASGSPASPGHRAVASVRRLVEGGGRVDWSVQGDRLAFDRQGDDGLYDVWILELPSGTERCVTCDVYDFSGASASDPAWHPSGGFLVARVQGAGDRSARRIAGRGGARLDPDRAATPVTGLGAELWLLSPDGRRRWQLTGSPGGGAGGREVRAAAPRGGVHGPRFSHEADLLAWTERFRGSRGTFGEWVVRVGRFAFGRGTPRLEKVKSYRPEGFRGFVAATAFAPDDRSLLVTVPAALDGGGGEIWRVPLEGGDWEPLSRSPAAREEAALFLPGGGRLLWTSDRGQPPADRLRRRTDLWLHDPATGREERLTFFNHPDSDHFLGEARVTDVAASPRGDRLALHVVSAGRGGGVREDVWLVELSPDGL